MLSKKINKFGKELIIEKHIHNGPDNNIFLVHSVRNRRYILRESKRVKANDELEFERDFSRFLYKNKIPVRLLIGRERSNKGKRQSVLMSYRRGNALSVMDITSTQAFNAGKVLARFHSVSKDYVPKTKPHRYVDDELKRVQNLREKVINTFVDGKVFMRQIDDVLTSHILADNKSNVIIHNDFRAQNVLFTGNDISAILDFDWSCIGNEMKDLGHAMVEWSFPDGGNFSADIFKAFFNGYKSEVPSIDTAELAYWIAFSCLSDTATYIADCIDNFTPGGKIMSWMYDKYLFFNGKDIQKLTE